MCLSSKINKAFCPTVESLRIIYITCTKKDSTTQMRKTKGNEKKFQNEDEEEKNPLNYHNEILYICMEIEREKKKRKKEKKK